ncbi:MAG: deoxycytidylate deaminase [Candidatus Eremiobacteraeota bacterium]|nr:deoxycytidylate deaminase [Candidatus Eremiobacteraeota bacterium]
MNEGTISETGSPPLLPATVSHTLDPLLEPDIVIGLVGAMGTELKQASSILRDLLRNYRYDYDEIHISDLFSLDPTYKNDRADVGAFRYYVNAIRKGNEIRKELGTEDALAQLAIREISIRRNSRTSEFGPRRAFIVRSLKLPEEIEAFRAVYNELFYCVAIHSHESIRLDRMIVQCNESYGFSDPERARAEAMRLITTDAHEDAAYGQNVRDAFVKADYYIRSDSSTDLNAELERFLQLIFDEPFITPTRGEIGMSHAYIAGLRSADLSRQVGASIIARDGRVLTTGCNEVPRAGGGQYWAGDLDDGRDFQRREDINDRKKRESILEIAATINGYLRVDLQGNPLNFYNKALRVALKGTRVDSLLEFSRVVHAEMAAMNSASLDTISIRDTDLYCTTFPCHMCGRQIINVGLRNVFYIEPYPKSLTGELFSDAVIVDPQLDGEQYNERIHGKLREHRKVAFIPFSGVAPRRYGALFANKKRKDDEGKPTRLERRVASPRRSPISNSYRSIESSIKDRLDRVVALWKSRRATRTP